jgi:hypothetical protein
MNESSDELPESVKKRVVEDLMKKKRKLVVVMKKSRKVLAKARAEKKRVNEEIKKLRKTVERINTMTPEMAQAEVAREIGKTRPSDIYPDDLEKEFDKIDRIHDKSATDENQVMDANMGEDKPAKKGRKSVRESEVHGTIITVDGDEGVMDLGDDEVDEHADLAGVGIGPDFGYTDTDKDADEATFHD